MNPAPVLSQPALSGLYAIADTAWLAPDVLEGAVAEALRGGARAIQYRDKSQNHEERQRACAALGALCRQHRARFIVNDDIELAVLSRADGVHLGRDDAKPKAARARLGPRALIGVSCYNDLARALETEKRGADYVAFGSFFSSHTKPDAVHASVELLREARGKLTIPIVAIGGITPDNGAALIEAGAAALAVIEGVFGKPDIRALAARYVKLFEANPRYS